MHLNFEKSHKDRPDGFVLNINDLMFCLLTCFAILRQKLLISGLKPIMKRIILLIRMKVICAKHGIILKLIILKDLMF